MAKKIQKTRIGRVLSRKMDKTAIVAVETDRIYPLYHKRIKKMVNYKAHDEKNQSQPGDLVRLIETRPMSKEKRWRIAEIIAKAEVAEIKPEEIT
jgi:small subunit ribosomal protein S17